MNPESPVATPASNPTPATNRWRRFGLVALVLLSLGFSLSVIAFRAGLDATPYETTDSAGREMGFNDPFSWEHYGIIFQNCSPSRTLAYMGQYEWLLVVCHALATMLLLWRPDKTGTFAFFLAQPLIFPWGLPGQIVLFASLWGLLSGTGSHDREWFIDIPYIPMVAHSFWLLTVAVITWRIVRSKRESRIPDVEELGSPLRRP
jgi:hypothetical protein